MISDLKQNALYLSYGSHMGFLSSSCTAFECRTFVYKKKNS